MQVLVHGWRFNVIALFGSVWRIQVDLVLLLYFELSHKLAVVIEIHWDIHEDLILLLNLDLVFHLAVVNRHIEVNLVTFLEFHGINHLAVVVVVDWYIDAILLLLLHHRSINILLERACLWHVVTNLILSCAFNLGINYGPCEAARNVHLNLLFTRFLEAFITISAF